MEQVIRDIIARVAEVPNNFSPDAHLRDDLKVDSYRTAEIIFEIERVCQTRVPDHRFAEAQTLREILSLLSSAAA